MGGSGQFLRSNLFDISMFSSPFGGTIKTLQVKPDNFLVDFINFPSGGGDGGSGNQEMQLGG